MTRTGLSFEGLSSRIHWLSLLPSTTVSWMAMGLIVAAILAATVLAIFGIGQQGTVLALQLTARWSFLLFWFAYTGSTLAKLFGLGLANLARRGRDFGLAYASAQLVHVGLVLWIIRLAPAQRGGMSFFWIGILCTYLLALLSVPSIRDAVGTRLLQIYRTIMLEYIALVFVADFILSQISHELHPASGQLAVVKVLAYAPFEVMLAGGIGLRVVSFVRQWIFTTKMKSKSIPHSDKTMRVHQVPLNSERKLAKCKIEGGHVTDQPTIFKIMASGVGVPLLALIGMGLWDLLRGLNFLGVSIALAFVLVGAFNTWGALNSTRANR